jgi:sirohydrochlorin ferrochelatase
MSFVFIIYIHWQLKTLKTVCRSYFVCHPLFLSPRRHATDDVPRLIQEATNSIKQDGLIPNRELVDIVTAAPLGSRMDALIDVIGDIVEEKIRSSRTF